MIQISSNDYKTRFRHSVMVSLNLWAFKRSTRKLKNSAAFKQRDGKKFQGGPHHVVCCITVCKT